MTVNKAMNAFLREHYKDADSLRMTLKNTKTMTDQIPRKLRGMQARYLERNPALYTDEQIALLEYYLSGFLYKEFSCDWLTEQIWGLVHTGDGDPLLVDVLENSLHIQHRSDADTVAFSLLLDNFLVQAAAFVDFYLLYLWVFFKEPPGNGSFIKWDRDVKPMLEKIQDPSFSEKAKRVSEYISAKVFSSVIEYRSLFIQNWGGVAAGLRNKVVHRDRDMKEIAEGLYPLSKLIKDWPDSLRAIECARFCEDVRGGMFRLITTLAHILYDEPWRPGPAIDGVDP